MTTSDYGTYWQDMRLRARLAGWVAMRERLPREQWDSELCDEIADAAVEAVRKRLVEYRIDSTDRVLQEAEEVGRERGHPDR